VTAEGTQMASAPQAQATSTLEFVRDDGRAPHEGDTLSGSVPVRGPS
jgi:hypothetical protein